MTLISAAVAKIMLLTLVAVFPGDKLDSVSFIGPDDLQGCLAQTKVLADEWKKEQPDILAVLPDCHELDDPRPILKEFLENHPKPPEPLPEPHIPGRNEA